MAFRTITAPHVNVNDLEMIVVRWHVEPWQFVEEGETICEVETTKAVVSVDADHAGYVYPLVEEKESVKVGEPLAHIFPQNDPKQLGAITLKVNSAADIIITKKAQALMQEFGLAVSDFPRFSSISSETVIAKIRELKPSHATYDQKRTRELLSRIEIGKDSVAIYGERNQALLALDAFEEYTPVAYISSAERSPEFYGMPVIHTQALSQLMEKGLRYVYICGGSPKVKEEQEKECARIGLEVVSVVHPDSTVSSRARLGKGVFVGAQAAIGPDVEIGDFSQVLSGATVAHHCRLGKYVSISDGARLGGNVSVGDGALIGIGANINKRITIGRNAVVVSGATVIDHVPDNNTVRLNSLEKDKKTQARLIENVK